MQKGEHIGHINERSLQVFYQNGIQDVDTKLLEAEVERLRNLALGKEQVIMLQEKTISVKQREVKQWENKEIA